MEEKDDSADPKTALAEKEQSTSQKDTKKGKRTSKTDPEMDSNGESPEHEKEEKKQPKMGKATEKGMKADSKEPTEMTDMAGEQSEAPKKRGRGSGKAQVSNDKAETTANKHPAGSEKDTDKAAAAMEPHKKRRRPEAKGKGKQQVEEEEDEAEVEPDEEKDPEEDMAPMGNGNESKGHEKTMRPLSGSDIQTMLSQMTTKEMKGATIQSFDWDAFLGKSPEFKHYDPKFVRGEISREFMSTVETHLPLEWVKEAMGKAVSNGDSHKTNGEKAKKKK